MYECKRMNLLKLFSQDKQLLPFSFRSTLLTLSGWRALSQRSNPDHFAFSQTRQYLQATLKVHLLTQKGKLVPEICQVDFRKCLSETCNVPTPIQGKLQYPKLIPAAETRKRHSLCRLWLNRQNKFWFIVEGHCSNKLDSELSGI